MDPRPLGARGPRVPPIGLGTVKLGRNTKVKYPGGPFDLPDDEQVETLLAAAVAMGATLFDTAPAYGTSEERLGDFVSRHRDEIVLVSKAGESYADGTSTYDFSPAAVRASVERSLERMRTTHLDVLLLHAGGNDLDVLRTPGLRDELARLKDEGLARAVGVSGRTDAGLREAADLELDVVMTGFSLADTARADVLAEIHERGVGVLAIKGLGSGHLVCGETPTTPADAVRFVLAQPFVDCLVVGTLEPDHLRDAVEAAS